MFAGFQSNAFQSAPGSSLVLLGGKDYPAWHYPTGEWREEEYQAKLAEQQAALRRIDEEILEAERRRIAAFKRSQAKRLAGKAAIRLATQERELLHEINGLRIQRAELMRMIDDNEAIIALLLSLPLH